MSLLAFFVRLACMRIHKHVIKGLYFAIAIWTLAATTGAIRGCGFPDPWRTSAKCHLMMPYWIAAGVADMVIDIVMVALPLHLVGTLQMERDRKIVVMLIFAIRLVYVDAFIRSCHKSHQIAYLRSLIVASTLRLVYLPQGFRAPDPFFHALPAAVATQSHSTLSVIVACIPALKPFVDNAKSGMLNMTLASHMQGTTYSATSYNMAPLSGSQESKGGGGVRSKLKSEAGARGEGGQSSSSSAAAMPHTPLNSPSTQSFGNGTTPLLPDAVFESKDEQHPPLSWPLPPTGPVGMNSSCLKQNHGISFCPKPGGEQVANTIGSSSTKKLPASPSALQPDQGPPTQEAPSAAMHNEWQQKGESGKVSKEIKGAKGDAQSNKPIRVKQTMTWDVRFDTY